MCSQLNPFRDINTAGEPAKGRVSPGESQAVAFEVEPARPSLTLIVIEPGEQFATAHRKGVGETLLAECGIESEDVGFGFEPKCASLRFEPTRPVQRLQPMQRFAKVGVGELAFLLGPKQGCQLRAAYPRALQRQKHKQLIAPFKRQSERFAAVLNRRRSEQR